MIWYKNECTEEPVSTPQGSVVSRCLCRPRDGGYGKAEMRIPTSCQHDLIYLTLYQLHANAARRRIGKRRRIATGWDHGSSPEGYNSLA